MAPDDGQATARDLALIDVARRLEAIRHRHRAPLRAVPGSAANLDEHAVVSRLEASFDTRGRVRVTGAHTSQAWLSVSIDPDADVPHVAPTPAPALRRHLTELRAMAPDERAVWIQAHVAGQMLFAARQALASVPQLGAVAVLARLGHGAPVAAANVQRDRLDVVDLSLTPCLALAEVDPDVRVHLDGTTLRPLTLLR